MMAEQILTNRYELGGRLGVGGMSTVLHAFDRRLERDVAVKLLAEHLADDSQFVARFRREALSAARLVHPNIVQVFDFGLDEASHRHYIVMELVRGQSGAEILRDRGMLDLREALSIVAQACRGLEYAHRNGVVHRDVKPGNLLRGEDDVVKLADFGIAKAVSEESGITQVGSVLGTAAYLAPEQAAGERAGPPADLYALGVVTYQLLSGRLPYEAQSLTELALKQQREMPPRLDELNPEVTPQLALAVDRALALDPRDRPASADALRRSLADGARGVGPDATSATRVAGPATSATSVSAPRTAGATSVARAPVQARQPRAPRAPRPAPPAPVAAPAPAASARGRQQQRRQRRPRRARRVFGALLILLLLAAGGAAAVVATSTSDSAVRLRRVVYDDVQQGVDQIKQLVRDNTGR
ncbi:MAG: eukaryotic-like serine/threonine-protein kinase [Solirubrobacteraceae bacterium]|jgi:serine/threonine-protein kinase|nr:eukaryotic-like serine/threonine-protein kinase [Solirubrobacteraceae bacterium]